MVILTIACFFRIIESLKCIFLILEPRAARSAEKARIYANIFGSITFLMGSETEMANDIESIMDLCKASKNEHLAWFGRLLSNHFEGIIAHATFKISSGKIEGINNKIKTLRRQAYGLPDDEYFFLRIFDISRQDYVRNPSSHKICD